MAPGKTARLREERGLQQSTLINRLLIMQAAEGVGDAEFGNRYGIGRGQWGFAKNLVTRLGPGPLARIALTHPALRDSVVDYLMMAYGPEQRTPPVRGADQAPLPGVS